MHKSFFSRLKQIDWVLYLLTLPILAAGLVTMYGFGGDSQHFYKQIVWVVVASVVFILFNFIDLHFLRKTHIIFICFNIFCFLLLVLFALGHVAKGAQSWFAFGSFSFQPSDGVKLLLILMCAKYFSRRHVEIKHPKHILISGLYMLVPFLLVLLQPDFGSAIIIFLIWFGMTLVSGLSKRHLIILSSIGVVSFVFLWIFMFKPYQKDRILNFVNPSADVRGSGYNARQSLIAVGSGKLLGKGVGFGTQSRLQFLPEYQTDFIFAGFAEEWGFVGSFLLLLCFCLLVWRIIYIAQLGSSNFEILSGLGIAIFILSHMLINIGMNIGIMPVTGITLPFMSYGGSHLLTEFAALGLVSSMYRYRRAIHRDDIKNEFLGLE